MIKVKDVSPGAVPSTELTNNYNQKVKLWGRRFRRKVATNAGMFTKGKLQQRGESVHTYKFGKKAGKIEKRLVDSLLMKYDKKYGEIYGVGLKLAVHGIFREYGVGNGTKKAMVGMTKRTKADWMSKVFDSEQGDLADIAAQYKGDLVLSTFNSIKK